MDSIPASPNGCIPFEIASIVGGGLVLSCLLILAVGSFVEKRLKERKRKRREDGQKGGDA